MRILLVLYAIGAGDAWTGPTGDAGRRGGDKTTSSVSLRSTASPQGEAIAEDRRQRHDSGKGANGGRGPPRASAPTVEKTTGAGRSKPRPYGGK